MELLGLGAFWLFRGILTASVVPERTCGLTVRKAAS
jgi:hypothetical protein